MIGMLKLNFASTDVNMGKLSYVAGCCKYMARHHMNVG